MSRHTIQEIFQLLKDNNLNQLSLRTALMLQTSCLDWAEQSRQDNRFTDFAELLLPCFDSPHSTIRKLALRLLQCFEAFLDVPQLGSENVQENALSIFDILLKAEETPADFHQYRERAALLRRLKFTSLPNYIGQGAVRQLQLVVLKIVLAQYYERLTVYWPLMVEVIESFAYGLQIDEFWSALLTAVARATAGVTAYGGEKAQQREGIRTDSIHIGDVSKIAHSQLVELDASAVDYSSFRIRMFKLMLHFPELAERRTRLISPLLLDLYSGTFRTEFLSLDSDASALPISPSNDEATSANTDHADEESGKAPVTEKSAAKRRFSYKRSAIAATSLKILLQLFSKFSNGKMADKQRELYDVYLKLLLSNDSEVQKNALECLFTYKEKFIQPYRENLQNLLNEKKLRDELVLFTVDEQNCVVADEHRRELIPIVMRILYGIFRTHAPARARAKARAKRAAIFRFIGSCRAEELGVFFRLIFEAVFDEFKFNDDSSFALTKTVESVSAKEAAVVPLRKLRSIMANLKDAVRNFAVSLSQEQVDLSFGALMVCGVLIRSGLGSSDDYTTKLVRALRIQFFDTVRQVLESFKSRVFTAEQLQCLIAQIIGPMTRHYNTQLQPEDGPSATSTSWILPLSMARLVLYWIGVQRYRGLLNARVFEEASPLSLLCNTLSHAGTPSGMQFKILRGILQLLSTTPEESSATPPPYTLELVPQLPVETSTVRDAPLETLILLPRLNGLLQHLSEKIPRRAGKASKLPVIYLEILSRVSPFVQDGQAGALFVATLLSYLTDRRLMRNEGKLVQIMNTIADLSRHVEEPLACLSRLSKLVSSLKERSVRDALVNLLRSLRASKQVSTRVADLIEVFVSLEAWDKNRINEPDASVRLDAYDRIQKEYNSRSYVPKELLELLVHSHAYCMSHCAELSLRTVASASLRALIGHIAKSSILEPDAKLPFVKSCVLRLVLEGMNSMNESCRFEFAQCLMTILATFPGDPQFAALNEIDSACVEGKEETAGGFFDSIMHLQVHRKQRAISKLNEQLNSPRMLDLSHSVLLRFVYPLVKPYLLDTSPKMATLVEHSLTLLCTIMKRTPWKGYHQVLEQYLKLVNDAEKTKTAIRVVAAILDAFHFDLDPVRQGRLDEEGGKDEQETGHQQVHKVVAESLMPRLVSCTRPNLPHYHRKAHVNDLENDDECLARAPLALSAVKLLTKLPKRTMDQYIHGFLSALNRLLLSRSISVRKSARKIVCQVAQSLGPARLPSILNELKQTMTKGYQVHVMIYTVHSIIAGMRESIRRGDLDTSLEVVLEVCKMELFGEAADEKESESIKVPEAKTSKSGDTYALLGEFISVTRLDAVLKPMIEIVESKPSAETMRKLCELLRAFSTGLKKGGGIDPLALVRYSHGMLDRNLSTMLKHESQALVDRTKSIRPPSCLLLDPEPRRLGVIVKSSARSRVSVFVEFALQLLHDAIKARRGLRDPDERNSDNELVLEMNPFVPLISDCLKLKYDKIVALSLRCLSLLLKYKLEQMSAESPSLVDRLFVILSEHAGQSTTASGRSVAVELTTILFKCFSLIIRIAPLTSLTPKRVQLLLNYAEADLLDSHKQATAFSLVRVMIERKIEDEKISQLVDYLSELAITSGDANVRVRCRQNVLLYVTAHPVGQKSCNRRLEFFLNQMEYEFEDGRLSALEMVHSMIDASPADFNNEIAFLTFVKLAPRLVNDESERCRDFASLTIRKLAGSVNQSVLNDLYLATKDWLSSEKEAVRLLALRLFGEFMQSAVNFASRLAKIISQVAAPLCKKDSIERCGEDYVRASYQFMALAVCKSPARFLGALPPAGSKARLRFTDNLRVAMRHVDSADLQLSATHLLSLMMGSEEQKVGDYVCNAIGLPTVCEDLCFQIGSDSLACVQKASSTLSGAVPLLGEEEFARVCHKLSRLCWKEAVRHPEEAFKRLTVFELLSQFARGHSMEAAKSDVLCAKFMPLIHRELNHKSPKHTDELHAAASELATIVKRKVGEKKFTAMLSECQKASAARVEERRREEKNLAVLDPAAAIARKQKRHERKKLSKKRKLDLLKPYRVAKRRRREELAQEEDAAQMEDADW